jgi:hypothetical protein
MMGLRPADYHHFSLTFHMGEWSPIALLRLMLGKQNLTRDTPIDWKFYGEIAGR